MKLFSRTSQYNYDGVLVTKTSLCNTTHCFKWERKTIQFRVPCVLLHFLQKLSEVLDRLCEINKNPTWNPETLRTSQMSLNYQTFPTSHHHPVKSWYKICQNKFHTHSQKIIKDSLVKILLSFTLKFQMFQSVKLNRSSCTLSSFKWHLTVWYRD